jgi:hypothetical protein
MMPKWKFTISREVISADYFERVIEADTEELAVAKAQALASEADNSCPDDVRESDGANGFGDFGIEDYSETDEDPDEDEETDDG